VQKKGKRIVGEAEEPEIESENMELDTDLDSIFCNLDHWEMRFTIATQWT
jgi:hypothetical protein